MSSIANNLIDSIESVMTPIYNQFEAEYKNMNPFERDSIRKNIFYQRSPSVPDTQSRKLAKCMFRAADADDDSRDEERNIIWKRLSVRRELKEYFTRKNKEREEKEKKIAVARQAEMVSKVSKKPVFIPDDCFKIVKDYMGVFDIPEIIYKRMMKITMVDISHHYYDDTNCCYDDQVGGFRISKAKSLSPTEKKKLFWSRIIKNVAKKNIRFRGEATDHTIYQAERVIKDSKLSLSEWNKEKLIELLLCPTKCQKEKDMFGNPVKDIFGYISWQYYSLASCVYEKF
jgi:hypothetical protein